MRDWDLLSSYAGLLSLATFSVYTGSFGSLPVRTFFGLLRCSSDTTAQPPKRKTADGKPCSDAGDEEDEQPERLSSEDAWLFPVVCSPLFVLLCTSSYGVSVCLLQIGSVLLFGLYLVVKYFGTEWINWLLQWYFTIAGIGSGGKASGSRVNMSVAEQCYRPSFLSRDSWWARNAGGSTKSSNSRHL